VDRKINPKKIAQIGAEFTMSKKDVDLYRIDVSKRPICGRCGLVLLAGATDWYCLQCDDPIFYIRIDRTSTDNRDLEAGI
jgi:ribosomal protein S27AE